jgi:anaphase-promoting complex subunit 10
MAPPSGYPNPFNIFGRGRAQHPPPPEPVDVEDEFEDADEDYDVNAEGMELGEYDDGTAGEELDLEDDVDDTGDMDGEEIDEEIMGSQLEGDEEMHDQGTSRLGSTKSFTCTNRDRTIPIARST